MDGIRTDLLNGVVVDECKPCHEMERHGKVSGRQRQLLKTGIELDNFDKTLLASPYYSEFDKISPKLMPVDLQVDLGNYCNSACIFCSPNSSSMLASEFLKIGITDKLPPKSWSSDPVLINRFIDSLLATKNLKYVHFIGGETLIDPAFKKILIELINNNLTSVIIGFTTNLTVWNDSINDLLSEFKGVNLGLSIETLHSVNDYARYPSKINDIKEKLDKWVNFANTHGWLVQLRMTPTWMTIEHLDSVFEYAYINGITVESCNFLHRPAYMRMNVLPPNLRKLAIDNLEKWISSKEPTHSTSREVNTRNQYKSKQTIMEDASSYLTYLKDEEYQPELATELVEFIKKIEKNRNNSILDYMPHYEKFLRTHGY
jgi:sulfatase maturation enzyme AslB (radical SAM superfamily)